MGSVAAVPLTRKQRKRNKPQKRHRFSFIGFVGELFLTAGVITLLFVVWQMWINDYLIGSEMNKVGTELSEQWQAQAPPLPENYDPSVPVEPIILPEAADAEIFGVLRIPRLGDDFAAQTAGGVTRARTLDPIGVGHQPGTAMPGDEGNVVLAAHRRGYGAIFGELDKLQFGDAIVLETPDGWYTYRYRNSEYVTPNAVDTMLPVPQSPGASGGKYMTLITCSPKWVTHERIMAYAVFEEFTPRAAGEPASLASVTTEAS